MGSNRAIVRNQVAEMWRKVLLTGAMSAISRAPEFEGRLVFPTRFLRYESHIITRFVVSENVSKHQCPLFAAKFQVIAPGSMTQIMAASLMSLAFLVAHARAWPFVADDKNRMKLGTSAATAADDST